MSESGIQANSDGIPSDEQLELVAQHGGGSYERALAIVILARRQGRTTELRELIGEVD